MAVAQKPTPEADFQSVKTNILASIGELIDKHAEEILGYMDEAETRKISVTFPVALDFSESKASGTVKIRFSQSVTDTRNFEIDPPEQTQMFDRNGQPATEGQPNENGHELTVEQTMKRNKQRQRAKDVEDAPEE